MFSTMLTLFLLTGLLSSVTLAAGPTKPVLRAVAEEDVGQTMASFPGITFTQPKTRRSASEKRSMNRVLDRFQETPNWTPLRRFTGPRSGHMSAAVTLGNTHRQHGGTGYENITATTAYGTQYGVDVHFNNQKLTLALDTGSSDTWAVSAKANCTSFFAGSCYFGPGFAGGFTEAPAASEHLYIQYGDGEVVQGPIGYMTVTVGGLAVANQTVALANDTLWNGNNVTSGILGLAYPSITNAYGGPFGEHDPWYQKQYAPFFANMVAQGLAENYFSVAISRDQAGGALAFGGVPEDLAGVDYSTTAMAPIIIVSLSLGDYLHGENVGWLIDLAHQANLVDQKDTASQYSFYTIIPDGWIFGTSTDSRRLPYIIDTGTTLIYAPSGPS